MSCLNVSIRKATEDFKVGTERVAGGQMSVNVEKATPALSVALSLIPKFSATCSLIGERLKATVGIVCSLSEIKQWLKVSPDEIQWITDDMGVYFDVVSNVEWQVTALEKPKWDFSGDFNIDFTIRPIDFNDDFDKDFSIK